MPTGLVNFITTCLLTLTCSTVLFLLYRHAVAPILKRHNLVPLRNMSYAMSNRYLRRQAQYRRFGEERGYLDEPSEDEEDGEGVCTLSRDLEEGFKDDSDDENEEGDDRLRRSGEGR
ncbi:hypothetical protein BGX38DRAFT_1265888 [Terfezia claveryi]|nr:hypothetical protein BGX38DRAFT_1265888 [Terfezia claveryi]